MKLGVIGLGNLGLSMAVSFATHGNEVYGVDLIKKYTETINKKEYKTSEPYFEDLLNDLGSQLKCGTSLGPCLKCNVIFIYINDISKISDLLIKINETLENKSSSCSVKDIVIGSPLPVGYIDVAQTLIPKIPISYKPEFTEGGKRMINIRDPPITLIGSNNTTLKDILKKIFSQISPEIDIEYVTPQEAEIIRISIHGYNALKKVYINLISDICSNMDNINEPNIIKIMEGRIVDNTIKAGYGVSGENYSCINELINASNNQGIYPHLPWAIENTNIQHTQTRIDKLLTDDSEVMVFKDIGSCVLNSQKLIIASSLANLGKKIIIEEQESIILKIRKLYGNLFEYIISN